jgi:hypothetical protein
VGSDALAAVQTVSTAGALFAVYNMLMDKWSTLREFVRLRVTSGLHDPLAQLAVAMTGFGIVAGAQITPKPPSGDLRVVSIVGIEPGTELRDRVVTPFLWKPWVVGSIS